MIEDDWRLQQKRRWWELWKPRWREIETLAFHGHCGCGHSDWTEQGLCKKCGGDWHYTQKELIA